MKKIIAYLGVVIFLLGLSVAAQAAIIVDSSETTLVAIVNALCGTSYTTNAQLEALIDADGQVASGNYTLLGTAKYAGYTQSLNYTTDNGSSYTNILSSVSDGINTGLSIAFAPGAAFKFADLTGSSGSSYVLTAAGQDSSTVTSAGIILNIPGKGYIIAFEDGGGDHDYNDCVAYATPIPGAVWLLGSSLLGLVGLRRKLQA